MSTQTAAILEQVHQLPLSEREELYWQLGDSLFAKTGQQEAEDDELKATLDRRWNEITSGAVQCQDAFTVLNKIEAGLHAKIAASS